MSRWSRFGVKPLIRKNSNGTYWCHDKATYSSGWGETAIKAYEDWKLRDAYRSQVPRRGHWNIQDCVDWYKAGCPLFAAISEINK